MNDKFRLLEDDTIEMFGRTLYRIEALKDFGTIVKGEKGGFVEKEQNLNVYGDAWVFGNARVYGDARVSGDARVFGNARVCGDAWVFGNARVSGDARVNSPLTLIAISPIGSEAGTLTAFKNKQGSISVTRGCFKGTLDEFEEAVEKTHGDNEHAKTYRLAVELIKGRLKWEVA